MKFLNLVVLIQLVVSNKALSSLPEQIHIAFGDDVTSMTITWATEIETPTSTVEYGIGGLNQSVQGTKELFVDGGWRKRSQYFYKALLTNLIPKTVYNYHVGSENGWSEVFSFKTPDNEANWSPRLAIFGDMGKAHAVSLPFLKDEVSQGNFHAMIHVGDFAYDMHHRNGEVGDEFMRQIEPLAAYVPYMTSPGNHEREYNFLHYRKRFYMPNYSNTENMYYSWNLGPIHFIGINTEAYYYPEYFDQDYIKTQFTWLENDLKEATACNNRSKRPWIVVYGHRPMYASNIWGAHKKIKTRVGFPPNNEYALEPLFRQYNVDIGFWGHEHSYERLWPIYDFKVFNNESTQSSYTNAEAMVHITTGSAGCRELVNPFLSPKPEWSAFRSIHYGYAVMNIVNATHVTVDQVSATHKGQIVDSVTLIKSKPINCLEMSKK